MTDWTLVAAFPDDLRLWRGRLPGGLGYLLAKDLPQGVAEFTDDPVFLAGRLAHLGYAADIQAALAMLVGEPNG